MPDVDLAFRSAVALANAVRRRQIGCRELLEHYLARVERLNPTLNAVVTEKHTSDHGNFLECDLVLENADGERLVTGTATVEF